MTPNTTPQKSNTVRNVVLGCAVVLLLLAVVGSFAFYQFVYKPGRALIASGTEAFSSLEEISRIEEGVQDRSPYPAPADRRLSAEQVERFVAVQAHVRAELGPRFSELQTRFDQNEARGKDPSISEMLNFWRDLGSMAVAAKREQVAALNAEGFSLEEYKWVREQTYLALGMEQMAIGIDEVVAAVRDEGLAGLGDLSAHQERADAFVPPENRAIVEPYRAQLEEWAPLALLGL